jgi:hypothetical protein
MGYSITIGAFAAASAVLLAVAFAVVATARSDIKLRGGLLYITLVIVTFIALVRVYVFDTGDPFTLLIAVGAALPCAIAGARMVGGALGTIAAELIYESKPSRPIGTDYSLAETLDEQGDKDGALGQYWNYFCDEPHNPRPLFRGGAQAEAYQRFDDARQFYEAIREFFVDDRRTWANATLRLANILANHERNIYESNNLLESIVSRAADLDEGHTAVRILGRRVTMEAGERIA